MDTIKIYAKETPEYKRLEMVANLLTTASPIGTIFRVEETYFDFGQNWKWTTICATHPKYGSYQALSPRDHEKILTSTNIFETLGEVVNGKFWLDKEGR